MFSSVAQEREGLIMNPNFYTDKELKQKCNFVPDPSAYKLKSKLHAVEKKKIITKSREARSLPPGVSSKR